MLFVKVQLITVKSALASIAAPHQSASLSENVQSITVKSLSVKIAAPESESKAFMNEISSKTTLAS